MTQIDYSALVRDRFSRKSRRTVHHTICIDPDLYGELDEARTALQILELRAGDETQPKGDRRAGALSDLDAARHRADVALEKVREVSVVGVFKVLSADKQAERYDELNRLQEQNPDKANANAISSARQDILLTFDHFEDPDGNTIDLGLDDLKLLIEIWSQGEIVDLARKINEASSGAVDIPKFDRSSPNSQHLDGTSEPPGH